MHEEKPTSRNIPRPMKREIRARCGFGCVICGLPLYEYEHMAEWAIVKRHIADEITLLCDKHHREKTSKMLPKEEVAECNANPFNLRKNIVAPYNLHFKGKTAIVKIGSNTINHTDLNRNFPALVIDGKVLVGFRFDEGQLFIDAFFYDENNSPILEIVENQLILSASPWDIELTGTKLVIRSAHREILLEIIFQPPSGISITRGRILSNGVEILIRPTHIFIPNNNFYLSGAILKDNIAGIIIGNYSAPSGLMIKSVRRYDIDRKSALAQEKEMAKNIL